MNHDRRIRVLVVDDSVTVRRLVGEALAAEPDLLVVGAAGNGADALALMAPLRPHVVILDLEMPVMDGVEMLRHLREARSEVPVLVFSAHGADAPERTLQALWLGASDHVAKPAATRFSAAVAQAREELVWRIRALARGPQRHAAGAVSSIEGAPAESLARSRRGRAAIVAIGASTGGPRALAEVLGDLPADFPVPIVVVQHMPASFTQQLAMGLARRTPLAVREAHTGAVLAPGTVWIAPGNRHLLVERAGLERRCVLSDAPPENGCRPSVDPLFRSVAETFGPGALGVVLTGMGQDGLAGSREIRRLGGEVLAQDEATSVVWGMPGAIARERVAGEVLPLDAIGPVLVRRTHLPSSREPRAGAA